MSFEPPFDIEAAALTLRALANPTRLAVALRLLQGPCTVAMLETDLEARQPNLSQHLAELRETGIVNAERQSRNMIYSLAGDKRRRLVEALHDGFGGEQAGRPVAPPRLSTRPQYQAAVFARIGAR
ncbi:ArsR/SmtB family transcription factor [Lichenicoccus roseus]|uniref:Helix-turn-helix transcriptional regulator n=1 Tax=Lichenicoccus roseus TaxID=2683649 RepID=A0A5R9J079_9PROT|nr:metalloregulator ArsR/SmtB family transcription factor [Lichenicoccus roseus]TLU71085.1 helix-turn-helix transcriptional regulator [Lichenicoccus roseus]